MFAPIRAAESGVLFGVFDVFRVWVSSIVFFEVRSRVLLEDVFDLLIPRKLVCVSQVMRRSPA